MPSLRLDDSLHDRSRPNHGLSDNVVNAGRTWRTCGAWQWTVQFDIPVPNPDAQDREDHPTVPCSDILVSNAESWAIYGPIVFGMDNAPLTG